MGFEGTDIKQINAHLNMIQYLMSASEAAIKCANFPMNYSQQQSFMPLGGNYFNV